MLLSIGIALVQNVYENKSKDILCEDDIVDNKHEEKYILGTNQEYQINTYSFSFDNDEVNNDHYDSNDICLSWASITTPYNDRFCF